MKVAEGCQTSEKLCLFWLVWTNLNKGREGVAAVGREEEEGRWVGKEKNEMGGRWSQALFRRGWMIHGFAWTPCGHDQTTTALPNGITNAICSSTNSEASTTYANASK